ncbi:MAG: hypothetical protein HFE75_02015 [Firmicutes bacterium]|nr:hypothetical protein [Bacillota bacterium]NBI62888.1 hypothetical protein [Clostridiales bacterium]
MFIYAFIKLRKQLNQIVVNVSGCAPAIKSIESQHLDSNKVRALFPDKLYGEDGNQFFRVDEDAGAIMPTNSKIKGKNCAKAGKSIEIPSFMS